MHVVLILLFFFYCVSLHDKKKNMLINFGINFKVGENYLVFNMHAHTVHELRSGSAW